MKLSRRALATGALSLGLLRRRIALADVDDVFARVARARASVRTMVGPFEQTRTIGLLATDVHSHGTLAMVRPDRLRWELGPPDNVTFWAGPEGLAYRSAHGEGRLPASRMRSAAALDDLRTLLGDDLTKLRARWDLRVIQEDPAKGVDLEASAREGAVGPLRSIRLSLAPDLVRPVRALLVEGPHDRTVLDFGVLVVNGPVDEGSMRPPPP
jgi:hypothetical protein